MAEYKAHYLPVALLPRAAVRTAQAAKSIQRIGHHVPAGILPAVVFRTAQAAKSIQRTGQEIIVGQPRGYAVTTFFINRGRTQQGVYVYWTSPGQVDDAGTYYPYENPPWEQIIEVVGVVQYEEEAPT